MLRLFAPDALFTRIMNRIGDLLVLNILFLLCSLPVITIGASWTALYAVCFRFDTDKEGGLLKSFFTAFRENFKQSTALWLILLVCGLAAAFNACVCFALPDMLHYGSILFGAMLMLVVITAAYVFPLISQFSNDGKSTLRNAVFMSIGYLPRSLLMGVLNAVPIICLVWNIYLFFQLGFVWAALYYSAAAYANTFLLRKVFAPYIREEAENRDSA